MRIDKHHREWSERVLNRGPIPPGCVLPVHHAIQGHPESARLWFDYIDNVFRSKLSFASCPLEPCVCSGNFQGHKILLLRQVDDFIVACSNEFIYSQLLDAFDSHLRKKVKRQRLFCSFNGLDLEQGQSFIKVSCTTYIRKILKGHKWFSHGRSPVRMPMPHDEKTSQQLATVTGRITTTEMAEL